MATVTYIPIRRIVLTALRRTVGSRSFVIFISLTLGLALFLWARNELAEMFERNETGEIVVGVAEAAEGCVPPSLYFIPVSDEPGVYLGVVDFLGGGIADPSIMNIGRPSAAMTYDGGKQVDPFDGQRAIPAACPSMIVRLSGGFERIVPIVDGDDARVNVAAGSAVDMSGQAGEAVFTLDLAEGIDEAAARTPFRIEGVRDIWQFGYRRINFWNSGRVPVNVFLLDEPDFAFMSQNFEPILAPLRTRAIVAMHLSPIGRDGGNAFQVFSRYLDYDARLQSWLITVSTVFGIGISLMVEGIILLLLRMSRIFRPADADTGSVDDPRDIDDG